MPAKLSIKPTPNTDCVIYNDASESGWGVHDGVTGIGGGGRMTKYITTLMFQNY